MGEELTFSARALARVQLSDAAQRLAEAARALVPTQWDGFIPTADAVSGGAVLIALAEQVTRHAVIGHLRQGAGWQEIADLLDLPVAKARDRYGPAWEQWQRDAGAGVAASEGWLRRLAQLDVWCAAHTGPADCSTGPILVSGGLVWPTGADTTVLTREEMREAEQAVVHTAERELHIARYRQAERTALAKLADRPGLTHTSLWGGGSGPYVVARDGVLLGLVRKVGVPARWRAEPARGLQGWPGHCGSFTTLRLAKEELDRLPRSAADGEG